LVRLSGATQVEALILRSDGNFLLRYRDGCTELAVLDKHTVVSAPLVVLHYRIDGGGAKSLALVRAATGAEAHRRLRVWLRWRAQTDAFNVAV